MEEILGTNALEKQNLADMSKSVADLKLFMASANHLREQSLVDISKSYADTDLFVGQAKEIEVPNGAINLVAMTLEASTGKVSRLPVAEEVGKGSTVNIVS
jgi:hypothetical protein